MCGHELGRSPSRRDPTLRLCARVCPTPHFPDPHIVALRTTPPLPAARCLPPCRWEPAAGRSPPPGRLWCPPPIVHGAVRVVSGVPTFMRPVPAARHGEISLQGGAAALGRPRKERLAGRARSRVRGKSARGAGRAERGESPHARILSCPSGAVLSSPQSRWPIGSSLGTAWERRPRRRGGVHEPRPRRDARRQRAGVGVGGWMETSGR